MIKEIRYGGLASQPNEYISEDGESALLMNLVPEKDGLQPMGMGVMGFAISNGMKIFTHKPEDKTNYIAYGNGKVQWVANEFDSAFSEPKEIFATNDEIVAITSLGNVIIVSTTTAMHYARWGAQNDVYIYLGTQVPKVEMEFGLRLNLGNEILKIRGENKDIDISVGNVSIKSQLDKQLWAIYFASPEYSPYKLSSTDDSWTGKVDQIKGLTFSEGYAYRVCAWIHRDPGTLMANRRATIRLYDSEDNLIAEGAKHMTYSGLVDIKFVANRNISSCYLTLTQKKPYNTKLTLSAYKGDKISQNDYEGDGILTTQENFNALTGVINKFINQNGPQNDKFIYPFFVRYGVRLYDDNYSYVSQPILMMPNSGYAPFMSTNAIYLQLGAWIADLQYRVADNTNLDNWADIITAIDIFVSPPIYTYNQGIGFADEKFQLNQSASPYNSFGVGIKTIDGVVLDEYKYEKADLKTALDNAIATEVYEPLLYLQISAFEDAEIMDKVSNVENYYLIKSLDISEFDKQTSFVDLNLETGTLQALQARESLKDTTNKESLIGAKMTTYNNRLSLYGGNAVLPKVEKPSSNRGYYAIYDNENEYSQVNPKKLYAFVELKTNQGIKMDMIQVEQPFIPGEDNVESEGGSALDGMGWFYYPNVNAYKLIVLFEMSDDNWRIGEYTLKPHNFLDGAYWVGEALTTQMVESSKSITTTEANEWLNKSINNTLSMQNTIYTSEAENPWAFSVGNSRSIGDGELIGVASATKALSEGQYGQFPLYAFTSEGVWSLSVTSNGLFNPAQPVTRDVCKSTESITQLDQTVLFATDRGIMMLEGANTACITDKIESESPFDLSKLKGGDKLAEMSGIKGEAFNIIPFQDFIGGCSMVYDYTHQRIILYNKKCSYAYVFSLESKAWGMMESNIEDKINSYPDAVVVTNDGKLLNLSKESKESEDKMKGFMVSRALKLDGADVLKTINTIVQRGDFNRGDVSTILWGSRDLKNWQLVWSSKDHYMRGFRGTPYKYYRIGALTNLGKDESLIGASLNYEPKQTNKIR
jgi:hypothetical protein